MRPLDIPEILIGVLLIAWVGLILWQFRLKHRHH
jgi:hypothetical protein